MTSSNLTFSSTLSTLELSPFVATMRGRGREGGQRGGGTVGKRKIKLFLDSGECSVPIDREAAFVLIPLIDLNVSSNDAEDVLCAGRQVSIPCGLPRIVFESSLQREEE
jgi:hypothetical protein